MSETITADHLNATHLGKKISILDNCEIVMSGKLKELRATQYSMPVYSNNIEAVPNGYGNITIAPKLNYETVTDTSVTISTLETSITGFLEHVDDIRHIIPSRDFFTISKTSMGYVPTVYYQCFIEPDDSCSETDKLLHLKVRIKPDVAHNGRIARLYPEESEQAAIDDANRAIGRLRTILGRC